MPRYKYTILRYVPNVVRDEAVNVGVLIQGLEGVPFEFKFLPRSAAVHKLDPRADETLVRRLESTLKKARSSNASIGTFGRPTDEGFFDALRNEFTGNLQVTPSRGLVASHPREALDRLYAEFVAERGGAPRPISYQALAPLRVRSRLWTAFTKRNLVRPGAFVQGFVMEGSHAPWTFDLGAVNGTIRVINSIALNAPTRDTNLGRALVFRGMIEEVRAAQKKTLTATAIVEGDVSDAGFAQAASIIEDSEMQIVKTEKVEEFADAVARSID